MQEYIDVLTKHGFTKADQLRDFFMEIPYVFYCEKVSPATYLDKDGNKIEGLENCDSKHEYISLVFYKDKFVEGVYEWYVNTRNSKNAKKKMKLAEAQKSGIAPYRVRLARNLDELLLFTVSS